MIDLQGLTSLTREASELSRKPSPTAAEKRRLDFCLAGISAIKAGASLDEVELHEDNERRSRAGVAPVQASNYTKEERNEVRAFQHLVEHRTNVEGAPMLNHIGTYTGLSYFVPTGFFQKVFETMKAYDAVFSDSVFTQIRTTKGAPITLPLMDDTSNDASLISPDPASTTSVDIASPNQAVLGAYSFASRRWQISLEALQDMDTAVSAISLFRSFTAKALARGIGRCLVQGTGLGANRGLIPSLEAANAPVVTAAGSAANDGSSNTGANSIGTQDFANAYESMDASYLASPNCVWLMTNGTLGTLYGQLDKYGRPIIDFVKGAPTILGKPIKICPSCDSIGPSNTPVILIDGSYWATRLVVPGEEEGLGIKSFVEGPGLSENGLVAFRSFVRADGALLWSGSGQSPAVLIRNHS